MIVSHRLGLIHLKAIKVGGSSLEAAIAAHAGPDDIVTSISPPPPPREDGSRHREQHAQGIRGHTPWIEVRQLAGERAWNDYTKVCIVRNPWDLAVSRMFHRNPDVSDVAGARRRLEEMLETDAAHRGPGSLGPGEHIFMTPEGKPVVDRVLRYESLSEDARALFTVLGIPPTTLPTLKSASRSVPGHWRSFHTRATIERTGELWHATIAAFGYSAGPDLQARRESGHR